MFSVNELFYGENEPTWIVRRYEEEVPAYTRYMVPSVELRVPMCCRKCEVKIKKHLYNVRGVDGVICDEWNQKVTVTGNVDPEKILKKIKRVKKKADFWSRKEDWQL